MADENMKVTRVRDLEEALSEMERELNIRARCFPRWISEGKLSRIDAVDRLDRLASAFTLLSGLIPKPMPELPLGKEKKV